MLPVLTTFRNAMNSRNAMLNPTITTKVMPVAGCCSVFARAIHFLRSRAHLPASSLSGNRCWLLFSSAHDRGLQFLLNLFNNLFELVLEGIAITVRGATDPERHA